MQIIRVIKSLSFIVPGAAKHEWRNAYGGPDLCVTRAL